MAFDFLEISKLSLQLKIDFEHEVEIAFELTKKLTILSFVSWSCSNLIRVVYCARLGRAFAFPSD